MTARKLKVCGQNMTSYLAFEGIQMMIGDGNNNVITMGHIGAKTPCQFWILPQSQYFTQMKIGYDYYGPTYLQAMTNTN